IPVPTLNVVIEAPESDQGETADKPMPVPNAINSRVNAADATAPAAIAAQEIADICTSSDNMGASSDTMLGSDACDKVCIVKSPREPCAPALHSRYYISSSPQCACG